MERKPKYYNGVEYITWDDVPEAAKDNAKHQLRYFAPEEDISYEPTSKKRLQTRLNGPEFPFEHVVDGTNWYDRRVLSRREIDSWSTWNGSK